MMRTRKDLETKRSRSVETTEAVPEKKLPPGVAGGICKKLMQLFLMGMMMMQSRKWMILVATIWIQAFTGTNFDFSAYSSDLKSVLGISQVQLNYLATASDLGKMFGWSSGLALMYLPLWVVLFMAALMGFFGYGLQWLVIMHAITLPYMLIFLLCLLSGLSITWFNTVCFVLCIKNFPSSRSLALSLTVSFNGVSAAIYALAGNAINPSSNSLYLLLNAIIPLITSIAALIPILRQPPLLDPPPQDGVKHDSLIFVILNITAIFTGVYLLLFGANSYDDPITSQLLFGGAVFLLIILPLCIPGIVYATDWFKRNIIYSGLRLDDGSGFLLVDVDDLELRKELLAREVINNNGNGLDHSTHHVIRPKSFEKEGWCCCETIIERDQLAMLGEEHSPRLLVCRLDFWLYYTAYLCGGTIGLVYSNNLGQIAQSLGLSSSTTTLLTLYSSFSFFGRLISAAPDYIRAKVYFARTGWLAIALLPTPVAFCLLLATSSGTAEVALQAGTALMGLSSGFIFAAAVSITSELFGPNSVGLNHNILITNIPIGSLAYGFFAAIVYDSNAANSGVGNGVVEDSVGVCMGRQCYLLTFVLWGCLSLVGLIASMLLFLRTRLAYDRFEQTRLTTSTQLY